MSASIEIAQRLLREHKTNDRFRSTEPAIATLDDAYKVQAEFVELIMRDRSASRAGYKIGLTSTRMQVMCGIDQPIAGVILADSIHQTRSSLRLSNFGHLGVEVEIAVRLGQDLDPRDGPFDMAKVRRAVDAVCPAIELIDDRHADYGTLDVKALVADNAWSAGLVVGEFCSAWPDLSFAIGMVSSNNDLVDKGSGGDVLGHPFNPLVWLANQVAAQGKGLRAGDLISTGSLVTTRFPPAGGHYRFDVEELGSVELTIQR